jgi:hypothetical protein
MLEGATIHGSTPSCCTAFDVSALQTLQKPRVQERIFSPLISRCTILRTLLVRPQRVPAESCLLRKFYLESKDPPRLDNRSVPATRTKVDGSKRVFLHPLSEFDYFESESESESETKSKIQGPQSTQWPPTDRQQDSKRIHAQVHRLGMAFLEHEHMSTPPLSICLQPGK